MHRDCLLLLKVMMKSSRWIFFKCPFLSKYNRSTYACPSQSKNRGSRYQPPLPNATTVTVGWYHETRRDGRWEHSWRTGLTEPKAWLCIPRPPLHKHTSASWGSFGRAFTVSFPRAGCCRIRFLCIISLILTSWGAELKNLLLSKDISYSISKLRLWLCLSSLKMGYFSFPNYPNVVLLFIISLTKTINKTARVYSGWANADRHQSMSTNAQVNWFFKHAFLGTKMTEICWCKRKNYFSLTGEKKRKR